MNRIAGDNCSEPEINARLRVKLRELRLHIEQELDVSRLLNEIIAIALSVPNVLTAQVLQHEVLSDSSSEVRVITENSLSGNSAQAGDGIAEQSFKLRYGSDTFGRLSITYSNMLNSESTNFLEELCYYAALALSLNHSRKKIVSFENRLEVLNELNQLVSAETALERTINTLNRTIAFRFCADCAITLLLGENKSELHIKAAYGVTGDFPKKIPLNNNIFEKLLRFGGILSIDEIKQNEKELLHLADAGIRSAHAITIESGNRIQGVILIGFRDATTLNEHDNAMFEEFSRGAAIALARAESQEKLRKYTEELETLVQSRTADLEIQTQRAEEANHAKSQFVANMSHELRTPLTAIVAYSNVMSDEILGPINTKQKDALDAIFRSAQHLKELIDDVLDISKVEAGKTKPEPVAVSLSEILSYVIKLMHQTAVGKGVKLHPYKSEEDIRLFVDPRQTRQALLNLLSNAIKYTPSGGEVKIDIEVGADKVKILVIDSGIGIPPEDAKRLFERYERGSDSFSKDQQGTGIGLSLTKNLIELNNGKIGVSSSLGEGSTFWILLPRADQLPVVEEAIDLKSKRRKLDCRLDGLNILVVEDNESTCEVIEMILTQVGATVMVAHNVTEAKKIVKSVPIDAALVDLAMPEENGVIFIDFIRSQDSSLLSKMPLIVVSACVFKSDIKDAENAGASTFIAKPFQPQDLIETVRRLTTQAALGI